MPGDVYELITHAQLMSQVVLMRWHFEKGTALEADAGAALALSFVTNVMPSILGDSSHEIVYDAILHRRIWPTVDLQHSYVGGLPQPGGRPQASAPSFVASNVQWSIGDSVALPPDASPGHVRRGGKRIPGLTQVSITENGYVDYPGVADAIASLYAGLVAMAPGWLFVVAGYTKRLKKIPGSPQVPDVPPIRIAPVTGAFLHPNLGSQVSRKAGHGR